MFPGIAIHDFDVHSVPALKDVVPWTVRGGNVCSPGTSDLVQGQRRENGRHVRRVVRYVIEVRAVYAVLRRVENDEERDGVVGGRQLRLNGNGDERGVVHVLVCVRVKQKTGVGEWSGRVVGNGRRDV